MFKSAYQPINKSANEYARMVELVDTQDLKSCGQ